MARLKLYVLFLRMSSQMSMSVVIFLTTPSLLQIVCICCSFVASKLTRLQGPSILIANVLSSANIDSRNKPFLFAFSLFHRCHRQTIQFSLAESLGCGVATENVGRQREEGVRIPGHQGLTVFIVTEKRNSARNWDPKLQANSRQADYLRDVYSLEVGLSWRLPRSVSGTVDVVLLPSIY